MLRFNFIFTIILMCVSGCHASDRPLKASGFVISSEGDARSDKWADYLYNHLLKRSTNNDVIIFSNQSDAIPIGYKQIHFEIDLDLTDSYSIEHSIEKLNIRVKSEDIALWIIYQLIDNIARDNDFISSADLPPSYIDFHTHVNRFDFDYREPHYRPNTNSDYSKILATSNLDQDWGIWGHNLMKVLVPKKAYYAHTEHGIVEDQFCFSSEELFQDLKGYILENYGYGELGPMYFMIAPNDNAHVCTCDQCKKLGNTNQSASGAVTHFLNRLALEMSSHWFYTIAYLSVKEPPSYNLEKNAGVFLSTIDLPKKQQISQTLEYKDFFELLSKWQMRTQNVYLWDYSSNFDDYLTPLPSMGVMAKQFKIFKSLGIKGIFLNASGYDYSSFDDLKTYVASALMVNTALDVRTLTHEYLTRFYPETHELLINYVDDLEDVFVKNDKPYELYAGFEDVKDRYINTQKLNTFLDELKQAKISNELEKEKVSQLILALEFTQLQVLYANGLKSDGGFIVKNDLVVVKRNAIRIIKDLSRRIKKHRIYNYKESDGELAIYLSNWNSYKNLKQSVNKLSGNDIVSLTDLSGNSLNKEVLCDGVLGFPTDYHIGWLISKDGFSVKIKRPIEKGMKLKLRFLRNSKHRYELPKKIEFYQQSKLLFTKEVQLLEEPSQYHEVEIPLSQFGISADFEIRISRPLVGNSRLAIDEIQLVN